MNAFACIDPGVSGGIYLRDDNSREFLGSWLGRVDAINLLRCFFQDNKQVGLEQRIFIERVHGSPVQGASTAFKFGQNYGEWLGLLAAFNVTPLGVTPPAWQKDYADKLAGTAGSKRKSALLKIAKSVCAGVNGQPTLKTCDALLFGRYIANCLINHKPHGGVPV